MLTISTNVLELSQRVGNVTGNVFESSPGRVWKMTIKDIARQCGVSVSTVSRVLNDRPDVSPAVRAAVLEAVRSSNYVPNIRSVTFSTCVVQFSDLYCFLGCR